MQTKQIFCFLFLLFGVFTIYFNVDRQEYFSAIAGLAMILFSIKWAKSAERI